MSAILMCHQEFSADILKFWIMRELKRLFNTQLRKRKMGLRNHALSENRCNLP
jgi:hypothetical protein